MDVVEETIDGVSYCSDVGQCMIDLTHHDKATFNVPEEVYRKHLFIISLL